MRSVTSLSSPVSPSGPPWRRSSRSSTCGKLSPMANENLSRTQFSYTSPDEGGSRKLHKLQDSKTGAAMVWNSRGIQNVVVPSQYQRQGIATAMWQEGHRIAEETPGVPAPKHSKDRTDAGDAWARNVGGRLPRRLK